MRPELNMIEKIERYLNQEMIAQEKTAFEQELAENNNLQLQYEHLQLLRKAVIRKSLKSDIQQFAPKSGYSFNKWTAIAGAGIVVFVVSFLLLSKIKDKISIDKQNSPKAEQISKEAIVDSQSSPETTKTGNPPYKSATRVDHSTKPQAPIDEPKNYNGLQTWVQPDAQVFTFDSKKGTTIEGKEGTLIVVPENAFLDKIGNVVEGNVQIELIEALKMSDMIAYNLTTTSNGKALSSGGMIYIQPYANGEKLEINPKQPLYIEIPTDDYNPEMKSWQGVVNAEGDITWENPQDLKKFLVRVDLDLLNFLPPNFEKAVHSGMPFRNHKNANKNLIDSLYYELNAHESYDQNNVIRTERILIPLISEEFTTTKSKTRRFNRNVSNRPMPENRLRINAEQKEAQKNEYCYLDPLSVKTIKTEEFANTFIATKEFEARLQVLHKIPNADPYLMLYINNLDKNLWEIDSEIAKQLQGEHKVTFENFAAQKCTNLKDAEIYQDKLNAYYQEKIEQFNKENEAINRKYQDANLKALQQVQNEINKVQSEFDKLNEHQLNNTLNLNNLPMRANQVLERNNTRDFVTAVPSRNVATSNGTYATPWIQSGWMNIDAYLKSIDDNSVEVNIAANVYGINEPYTKLYQCINTLKTLVSLNLYNNQAKSLFPDKASREGKVMSNTYTIGLQRTAEGKILMAEQRFNPYKTSIIELKWEEVDEKELKKRLQAMEYTEKLRNDFDRQEKLIRESIKLSRAIQTKNNELYAQKEKLSDLQQKIKKESDFIMSLKNAINPCESTVAVAKEPDISISPIYAIISTLTDTRLTKKPEFPGGEKELNTFVTSNFIVPSGFVIENRSGVITIAIYVNENGTFGQTSILETNMQNPLTKRRLESFQSCRNLNQDC